MRSYWRFSLIIAAPFLYQSIENNVKSSMQTQTHTVDEA